MSDPSGQSSRSARSLRSSYSSSFFPCRRRSEIQRAALGQSRRPKAGKQFELFSKFGMKWKQERKEWFLILWWNDLMAFLLIFGWWWGWVGYWSGSGWGLFSKCAPVYLAFEEENGFAFFHWWLHFLLAVTQHAHVDESDQNGRSAVRLVRSCLTEETDNTLRLCFRKNEAQEAEK